MVAIKWWGYVSLSVSKGTCEQMPDQEHNAPWRNENVLREKYCVEGLSTYEISERFGCAASTVQRWLDNFDIEADDPGWPNDEHPWHDESHLKHLRNDKGMSVNDIAEKYDAHTETIRKWFTRFGMSSRQKPASFMTRPTDGYEVESNQFKGKRRSVRIHRLCAIAWGKLDPSDLSNRDIDIHHKSNIPWDNREDNLEAIPHGEHRSLHGQGKI